MAQINISSKVFKKGLPPSSSFSTHVAIKLRKVQYSSHFLYIWDTIEQRAHWSPLNHLSPNLLFNPMMKTCHAGLRILTWIQFVKLAFKGWLGWFGMGMGVRGMSGVKEVRFWQIGSLSCFDLGLAIP